MKEQTALITGGASGVGLAVAQRWVEEGGRVALLDMNAAALTAAIESLGSQNVCAVADVSSDDRVRAAISSVTADLDGCLDAVINCAGIARPASAAEVSDVDWTGLVDIHLNGTMRVSRASYPLLLNSRRAAIVNVSSVAARAGMPGRSSYCAAKAGIEGLTRALAVEWASAGIRVNAVAPGYINSEMTHGLVEKGALNLSPILARTPLARLAEPSEIANAIVFLASPDASYVTGQTLYVDGGMSVDGNWY